MLRFVALVLALSVAGAAVAFAEDAPKTEKPGAKAEAYPLKTCIVSGEELGGEMGDAVTIQHEGRTIKFCCKSCVKKFNADPAKYLKVLDEAEKKAKEEGAKTGETKSKDAKTGEAKDPK
ncbi:MAG: hypothetical protein HY291_05800 [Planctomycetes bacterium]|nr:hypothetical protein [Planctomycetota bacterium]